MSLLQSQLGQVTAETLFKGLNSKYIDEKIINFFKGAQHRPHDARYDQDQDHARRRAARSNQFAADDGPSGVDDAIGPDFNAKHAQGANTRRIGTT